MTLAHLLHQTATVERYEGDGAYGPVYADPATIACRVEQGTQLVRDAQGDEVVSSVRLYTTMDVDPIPAESRVTVDGTATTVLTTETAFGLSSAHHRKITCR